MTSQLLASFYLCSPGFAPKNVEILDDLLRQHLPNWRRSAYVLTNEDDREPLSLVRAGSLLEAVNKKAVPRGGIGDLIVFANDESLTLSLVSSRSSLPPESNRYSLEVEDHATLDGMEATSWLEKWFLGSAERLPLRYAAAYDRAERRAKNILSDERGVRAIGTDFDSALPGLYWLNFFGAAYVDLIGLDKLLSAPAHRVVRLTHGVLLQAAARADDWLSPEIRRLESEILHHLGEEYFFSRDDPDRATVAPDFWSRSKISDS